jgi:hypothetical protein
MLTTSFTSTPKTPSRRMTDVNTPETRVTLMPKARETEQTRVRLDDRIRLTDKVLFYLVDFYGIGSMEMPKSTIRRARLHIVRSNCDCFIRRFTLASNEQINATSIPKLAIDYRGPSSRARWVGGVYIRNSGLDIVNVRKVRRKASEMFS